MNQSEAFLVVAAVFLSEICDMFISSLKNPKIKQIIHLREKRERVRSGAFGVEGAREISRALQCHYELIELFVCKEIFSKDSWQFFEHLLEGQQVQIVEVSLPVFHKIAVREGVDGLFAVFQQKNWELGDLPKRDDLLLIILESVEKPGNLGALLRTCDGVGIDGVIVIDENYDIYNPNVVRASLGAIFSIPVIRSNQFEALNFLRNQRINMIATSLQGKKAHYEADYSGSAAILLGSEAYGLTDFWVTAADDIVKIPMKGMVDSLNVSVSGAVVLYEAYRQRQEC